MQASAAGKQIRFILLILLSQWSLFSAQPVDCDDGGSQGQVVAVTTMSLVAAKINTTPAAVSSLSVSREVTQLKQIEGKKPREGKEIDYERDDNGSSRVGGGEMDEVHQPLQPAQPRVPAAILAQRRTKRWWAAVRPGASGRSRFRGAQMPTKTTTSTTTTTTTTTTISTTQAPKSTGTNQGAVDDEAESEEYEETGEAADQSAENESGSAVVEEAPSSTSTTTTSSTTTTEKPARKSTQAGKSKEKAKGEEKPAKKHKKVASAKKETSDGSESNAAANETERRLGELAASEEDSGAARHNNNQDHHHHHHHHKKALVRLPFIKPKNESICTPEAYLEFPPDPIGNKWRDRGFVLVHIAIVCYMFYSLALVCERYFMPSLEEFAERLHLSEDVAGATLMSAGSSAPELFTAILGVFIAKGDVGTGAIVGSAVFNILFVIGLCSFVCTTSAQLNWWPVLRDSVFYTFTVLVLILFIYDERVTALESFAMLTLYGLYILIMIHNEHIKAVVTRNLQSHPLTSRLIGTAAMMSADGSDEVFAGIGGSSSSSRNLQGPIGGSRRGGVEDDSMFLAACLVIVQHKRLFRSQLRFQAAARYIIIKRQHRMAHNRQQKQRAASKSDEVNYFGPESEPLKGGFNSSSAAGGGTSSGRGIGGANQRDKMEAYARGGSMSKNKFSIVSKDDYEFWNRPPEKGENYYIWLAKIPVNYVLHYTVPDCSLYPDKYLYTFFISITWTAFFSYVMVWMVTLIGYTIGVPDSVMGVTFLAAGTSIPDCYSSVHAARNGLADMAVSNSIGSNVFDILIGLSLPWFIQTAIYPGVVATINSRGVIYSVILLFLSLIVTIYLMNKYEWTLKPRLGLALLIAYGLFIVLTCMLEFNLFGHVNPPPCPVQ